MDEHRIGLKPITRGVWAPIGERPIALGHHRFEWLYVTGFVEPPRTAMKIDIIPVYEQKTRAVHPKADSSTASRGRAVPTRRRRLVIDGEAVQRADWTDCCTGGSVAPIQNESRATSAIHSPVRRFGTSSLAKVDEAPARLPLRMVYSHSENILL
jgi:hypothetical protein